MNFSVTLSAPKSLAWDKLVSSFTRKLEEENIAKQTHSEVVEHFAYLIRVASWEHGVDWDATRNKITVSVPNNFASNTVDSPKGLRDGLTSLLEEIFNKYSTEEVLKYFVKVDKSL